ncbi:MAG: hypothetical protein AB7G37_13560 [Solirubrobacteraceae bacterium]
MTVARSSVLMLLAALVALGAPSVAAAESWGPAVDLAPPARVTVADVRTGVTSDGTAVAAWYTRDPSVMVAVRGSDASAWSGPVDLTALTPGAIDVVDDVQVATGPEGVAVVSWWEQRGAEALVRVAVRRPGAGTWSVSSPSESTNASVDDPFVAIGPDGTVAAVWKNQSDFLRINRLVAGGWDGERPPHSISPSGDEPRMVYTPSGALVLAYRYVGADGVGVVTMTENGSGTDTLTTARTGDVDLAVDGAGRVVAVWEEDDGSVRGAVRDAVDGVWAPSQRISATTDLSDEPQVAASADGFVTTWESFDDATDRYAVGVASLGSGSSSWSAPAVLASGSEVGGNPDVAAAPDGSAAVLWEDRSGAVRSVRARTRSAGSASWGLAQTIIAVDDGYAEDQQVAAYPDGSFVAAWHREVRGHPALESPQAALLARAPVVVPPPGDSDPPTTPPVTAPVVPVPPIQVPPVDPPPSVCAPYVEIVGLQATGTRRRPRIRLTAVTAPSLVGRSVVVRRDGRRVGKAKVRRDRSVSVSVAAPRGAKARARARYRLVVGSARSRALKATRSATISRVRKLANGRRAVTGRVRSIRRRTTLTVTGITVCGDRAPVRRKVRTDARGRFRVTLTPGDGAGSATIFRIAGPGKRTVTLPVVLATP